MQTPFKAKGTVVSCSISEAKVINTAKGTFNIEAKIVTGLIMDDGGAMCICTEPLPKGMDKSNVIVPFKSGEKAIVHVGYQATFDNNVWQVSQAVLERCK